MKKWLPALAVVCGCCCLMSAEAVPAEVKRIQERFLAPCCWRESLAVHRSPEGDRLRAEVAAMVKAGRSEQDIVDRFVSEYGARILREPLGETALWLRVGPWAAALLGLMAVGWFVKRSRRLAAMAAPAAAPNMANLPDIEEE